jgi:hypothetical protein
VRALQFERRATEELMGERDTRSGIDFAACEIAVEGRLGGISIPLSPCIEEQEMERTSHSQHQRQNRPQTQRCIALEPQAQVLSPFPARLSRM